MTEFGLPDPQPRVIDPPGGASVYAIDDHGEWHTHTANVGSLAFKYERRTRDAFMGRFGGGWQWNVGVQASQGFRTVIVSLLVCSIRVTRRR